MQRVELELQEVFLFVCELRNPRLSVEFCFGSRLGVGIGLWGAKKRGDAAVGLGLLARVGSGRGCFAFETHGGGQLGAMGVGVEEEQTKSRLDSSFNDGDGRFAFCYFWGCSAARQTRQMWRLRRVRSRAFASRRVTARHVT